MGSPVFLVDDFDDDHEGDDDGGHDEVVELDDVHAPHGHEEEEEGEEGDHLDEVEVEFAGEEGVVRVVGEVAEDLEEASGEHQNDLHGGDVGDGTGVDEGGGQPEQLDHEEGDVGVPGQSVLGVQEEVGEGQVEEEEEADFQNDDHHHQEHEEGAVGRRVVHRREEEVHLEAQQPVADHVLVGVNEYAEKAESVA